MVDVCEENRNRRNKFYWVRSIYVPGNFSDAHRLSKMTITRPKMPANGSIETLHRQDGADE